MSGSHEQQRSKFRALERMIDHAIDDAYASGETSPASLCLPLCALLMRYLVHQEMISESLYARFCVMIASAADEISMKGGDLDGR